MNEQQNGHEQQDGHSRMAWIRIASTPISDWVLYCLAPAIIVVLTTALVSMVLELLRVNEEIILVVAIFTPLLTIPLLVSFTYYRRLRSRR